MYFHLVVFYSFSSSILIFKRTNPKKYKKLWGHDPAHHELFLYTHTKNHDGVTFLVDKAKKIHDDFMERCARLEAIGEEIDEDKLFDDVVGGHD
uniref:Uncharacterized protein n=1 Tax=Lactuca sativa TaxID=4236 RepID=A0A9R1WXL0_LACSA|nr:hypothetical protein LSAT_V11C800396800 [Lactuca sativa]